MFEYPGRYFEMIRKDLRNLHDETEFLASLLPPHGNVLDLGCGTGTNLLSLADQGYTGIGVDQSQSFIEYAKNTIGNRSAQFVHANMVEFETSQKFDLVMTVFNSLSFLEYQQIPKLFALARQHTKPTGAFLVEIGYPLSYVEIYERTLVERHSGGGILIVRLLSHFIKPHAATWNHQESLIVSDHGRFEMYDEHYELQILKFEELTRLLKDAGFPIVDHYTDFRRGKKVQRHSSNSRMILVGHGGIG